MRKNIIRISTIAIAIAILNMAGCTKGNADIAQHSDEFSPLEAPETAEIVKDSPEEKTYELYDYTSDEDRSELINEINSENDKIAEDIVIDSTDSTPDIQINEAEQFSDYDAHLDINRYDSYNEDIMSIFIISGYDDNTLNAINTFIDNYNITTEVQFSDKISNLRIEGYSSIIVNSNDKDYILFISDADMYIKEIK